MSDKKNRAVQPAYGESEDISLARDEQLDLFAILDPYSRPQDVFSNSIELYDSLPKYVWEGREIKSVEKATLTRECTIRGKRIIVKIKPAVIERGDKSILIYPGEREELVEDALRKIAVNGQIISVNGKAGVSFTLYELRKELKRTGHTFSLDEIKEALFVCRGAVLECYSDDGSSVINSSYFGLMGLTTEEEFKTGKRTKCFVQFNPLVNDSIMNLTFRKYNYRVAMGIRSPLARFMYKRMAQYWSQASPENPYTPNVVSFLHQSPRGLSSSMYENLRAMRNAIKVLANQNVVLEEYEEEKVLEGKQKIRDVRYKIFPHPDFIRDVISANQEKNSLRLKQVRKNL